MSDTPNQDTNYAGVQQNPVKSPDHWVTGNEPATGPQLSYIESMAQESQTGLPSNYRTMSKKDASMLIVHLQEVTHRGSSPTTISAPKTSTAGA